MTPKEIEELLNKLNPQCDKETFEKVAAIIKSNVTPPRIPRSDQQLVDVYDSGLANDPLKW